VTLRRATVLCAGLASTVAVLGCAAHQPLSANGLVSMPLYDETAYYNAVKNLWFGLGDYATDQPGR
jgi:outer membrane protein